MKSICVRRMDISQPPLQSQFVRDRHVPTSPDETSTDHKGGVVHGPRAFSEETE